MKIEKSLNKNKTQLTVHVSMPLRGSKEIKKQLTTDDVVLELQKDGFEITKVVKPVHLLNISESRRKGIAIFELKVEKPKKKRKPTKKLTRFREEQEKALEELVRLSQEMGGYEELDENPLVHSASANLTMSLPKKEG